MVRLSQAQKTTRQRLRDLAAAAAREHTTPRELGMALGTGVFAACTPIGLHAPVALALATAFRLNRLWALVASRISILPVYLVVAFCEIESGHFVRTGDWSHLRPAEAFARRYELAADWAIGTPIVGIALATIAGALGYACARLWLRSRRPADGAAAAGPDRLNSRRPEGSPPPSLGSRTSAPPDPTS